MAAVFVLTFVFLGVGSGSTASARSSRASSTGRPRAGRRCRRSRRRPSGAPEGRCGVARLREQAPADAQARRRGDGADDVHDAEAEGRGTALQPAGGASTPSGRRTGRTLYSALDEPRTRRSRPTPSLGPKPELQARPGARNSLPTPLTSAVSGATSSATQNEYAQVQNYLTDRVGVYKKLAELNPQ